LGELANFFNYMANELKGRARRREERRKSRERAVAAERVRIARDLHDGMAQLLGYVNTKAMAVRLSLKNQQMEAADENLLQLEEAARELFVDVRAAILDLKMTGEGDANLTVTLNDFITQFSRLSDLPVEVTLAESLDGLPLTTETEQQLLRIVQESLTNVRKHASASKAYVSIQTDGNTLEMKIRDNGQGFDPESIWAIDQSHFGLTTMSERAEEIGAEFILESKPGAGTSVIVRLPLNNSP
jgi:signal transduction histidine kinase